MEEQTPMEKIREAVKNLDIALENAVDVQEELKKIIEVQITNLETQHES